MQRIIVHDYAGHPFTFELSKELSKKMMVYHIFFANDPGPKSDFNIGKNKNLKLMSVGKHINYDKKNFFLRFFKDIIYGLEVKKKINKLKPNFIISANCPTFAQQSIITAANQNNAKFIMWIQDFYSIAVEQTLKKKSFFLSFFVGYLFKFFEKRQVKLSNGLIIISQDFKKILLEWNIKTKKIFFIPNWGNLKKIKIKKLNLVFLKKLKLKKKFRVVYTGTLGLKHNPNLIINMAQKNSDIEFLISAAGSGYDDLKKINHLPKNIKLLSLQPFNVFNKVLNCADVFLAMLNKEASNFSVPSKILNYLCAGKPIILSAPKENLACKTILKAKAGKVFAPNNLKELNSFLTNLKNNKKLKLQMGKNSRKYAEKNFDIKKITNKFKKIFKEIT